MNDETTKLEYVAFASLKHFCKAIYPQFDITAYHIQKLSAALEGVENGTIKRLIITMPPRHGKSTLSSELFPTWYLGRNPNHRVMFAAYNHSFASEFGRKIRNHLQDTMVQDIFPTCRLSDDSSAADKFVTTNGGEYYAVGVGGSLTGRGTNLLIVDDPIKNREEAESSLLRQKLKDWYTSTAYTRLEPNGAVIVIQCMVGDTNILMGDSTQKKIKDIKIGDRVATYDNGIIKTSKVLNWANQGRDCIFAIKMKSGIIVRANERHPFLVNKNGKLEWIRLKDLRKNDIILKVIGENGKELSVQSKDARKTLAVKDCVPHTTANKHGLQDATEDQLKQIAMRTSNTDMGLPSRNIILLTNVNKQNVQYVKNHQGKMYGLIGEENYASIIVTTHEKLEDCYVTTATSQLDMAKHQKSLLEQQNTYQIIHDYIEEIYADGYEDVFDIQVENTENFIANGLISHNTRWHNDDLAGWLLSEKKDDWTVIDLPAIIVDQEGNERALWPTRYNLKALERIRDNLSSRDWAALYMQQPVVDGGQIFKETDMRYYEKDLNLSDMNIYVFIDPANSKKPNADNTAMIVVGASKDGNIYLIDAWVDKLNLKERENLLFYIHNKYNPNAIYYEKYGMQLDIEYMRQAMEVRNYRFELREIGGNKLSKEDRIMRLQPLFEDHKIYFPNFIKKTNYLGKEVDLVSYFLNHEFRQFPYAKHDDMIDVLARICDVNMLFPKKTNINYYELYQ